MTLSLQTTKCTTMRGIFGPGLYRGRLGIFLFLLKPEEWNVGGNSRGHPFGLDGSIGSHFAAFTNLAMSFARPTLSLPSRNCTSIRPYIIGPFFPAKEHCESATSPPPNTQEL